MPTPLLDIDVLADPLWQMHYGERFALEGILRALSPSLSIEVGRANGGSLRRIAAHSGTVHSFDLIEGPPELRNELLNVTFHTGDSSVQLPTQLAALAAAGQSVDFALVDGDHSAEGVRRDAEALLEADCCCETVIVFHDSSNEDVRAGLDAVDFEAHPKVALVMLDFVPGFVVEHGIYTGAIWNGLGVVALGDRAGTPITDSDRLPAALANRIARDAVFSDGPGGRSSCGAATAWNGRFAAAASAGFVAGAALGAVVARRR